MSVRRLIFWPHLLAGLTAGLIILTMAATGVLLTYERQVIAWADRGFVSVAPSATAPRMPLETLLARVRAERPDLAVTAITVAAAADAPVTLTVDRRVFYADAYSGHVLGEGSTSVRGFMTATRNWHRWLAIDGNGRPVARSITGCSNLLFLFIVCSGIYLWLPRVWTWARVRPVMAFRRGLRGKARDFNWHNTIGIWSAIPLFVIVFSAVPMSFPWANALVYRVVGDQVPATGGARDGAPRRGDDVGTRGDSRDDVATRALAGLDARLAQAEQVSSGWKTIGLRIPASAKAPAVFTIDRGDGGQPQLRSTLTLDRETGRTVSLDTFGTQTSGRRLRSILRFAHTGEILGVPGQTIAGLGTAGAVVLVWTGFALSLRRFRAWHGRSRQRGTGTGDVDRRDVSTAA